MPNHVINVLFFDGSPARISRMLEDIKDDEYGHCSVDFNKLIPMPPSLSMEESGRTYNGLRAYKGFVYVYTLGGTINMEHLSDIPVASEEVFLTVRTDIKREIFALGKQAWNNLRQYGKATWYDWRNANWGTRWNACCFGGQESENCIRFQTIWSEPKPVIEALARKYPDITIRHEWADQDLGAGCGRRVYENGVEIPDKAYTPEGEAASAAFALSVWDCDPCELGMARNKSGTRYICISYDTYECIEVCGTPALFTDERLTEDDIPEEMYLYHLRLCDDSEDFATLEAKVGVNHGGSVVTVQPIPLGKNGYIQLDDENYPNFLGERRSFANLMHGDFPEPDFGPTMV